MIRSKRDEEDRANEVEDKVERGWRGEVKAEAEVRDKEFAR